MAVARVRGKLDYAPIGFELLPETFTLLELRLVHEAILGRPLNKDSFRRKILDRGLVEATGERATGLGHRPPALYRVRAGDETGGSVMAIDLSALAFVRGAARRAHRHRLRRAHRARHIANWPIGIVSVVLFLILFLGAGLYADSLLQVLYISLGFYGWWHWLHGGPRGDDLPVTSASLRLRIVLVLGVVVAIVAFGASSMPRRTRPSPTRTPRPRC